MLRVAIKAGLCSLFLFNIAYATPVAIIKRNLFWAKNSCQCRYCNLDGVNLVGFKPGSQTIKDNSLYQQNPYVNKNDKMKLFDDGGWFRCDFTGADFSRANLNHGDFRVALRGYITPLARVDFVGANFDRAQLQHAIFYGNNLKFTKFTNADLRYVEMSLANATGAIFYKADLRWAIAKRDAMHGWGTDFRGADFRYADLSHAKLFGDFRRANFSHAKLIKAELSATTTAVAGVKNITGTTPWHGVDFSYANLTGAKLFSGQKRVDLSRTQAVLCHTVMPNGKISNRNCVDS